MRKLLLVFALLLSACQFTQPEIQATVTEPQTPIETVEVIELTPTQAATICYADYIARMDNAFTPLDGNTQVRTTYDCMWFYVSWGSGASMQGGLSHDGLFSVSCNYREPNGDVWNCEFGILRDPAQADFLNAIGWIYRDGKQRLCLAETPNSFPTICK